MKVTVVQANKFKSSVGFVFLLCFLAGCTNGIGQVGVMTKCRQAEVAVDTAQKEYEEALLNFEKKPTDQQVKNLVPVKVEKLKTTQENAFEMCNRLK